MSATELSIQTFAFQHFDPDQLRRVIDGADLEHTFLASSHCSGAVRQIHGADFSADSGFYSFPVMVRGRFTRGRLCIGMSWGGERPTWINGFEVRRASIQVYAEDCEMLYRAGLATEWFAVTVTRDSLQEAALGRIGRELPLPASGFWQLPVPLEAADGLMMQIEMASGRQAPEGGEWEEPRDRLLNACVDAIAAADLNAARRSQNEARDRDFLIRRTDRVLRENIHARYSSERVCRSLGVSERSLQTKFKDALGLGPKAYHQCLVLNAVRTRLLRQPAAPGDIARVAIEHGLEHFGHFSQNYRRLFGECPSETYRNALASRNGRPDDAPV